MTARYERRGRIGIVTLDRPEVRNAVDAEMAHRVEELFDAAEADDDVWAMIIAAAGPVFCAGADLRTVAAGSTAMTVRGGFAGLTSRGRSKPLIAAVDGPAVAGGFEIVLACDMVVAGPTAAFGIPEVRRGLVAGGGGAIRLPHRLPRNVACELAITGGTIDASRAHELGLVNRLAAPMSALDAALVLADEIVANPPVAVRVALDLVTVSSEHGEAVAWHRNELAMATVQATADFIEGPRAFLEKRAPVWTGR